MKEVLRRSFVNDNSSAQVSQFHFYKCKGLRPLVPMVMIPYRQCFKYWISAIYRLAKLYTGYRVIYRDMVLNTRHHIGRHTGWRIYM